MKKNINGEHLTIHNVHGKPPADYAWVQTGPDQQWYLHELPAHIELLACSIYDLHSLLARMLTKWEEKTRKRTDNVPESVE